MQWVLAFHLISMVAWFAGLFYLPRLFVYHAASHDHATQNQFKIMEHKLFWMIMTPAAIVSSALGLWLLSENLSAYLSHGWMIAKLILVAALWLYHLFCGHLVRLFKKNRNPFSSTFYRFFNEVPTVLLIGIILLAILQP